VAVDTALKRYSMIGLGSAHKRMLPIPNGSITAPDRAVLLFLYSGIALDSPTEEDEDVCTRKIIFNTVRNIVTTCITRNTVG